MHAILWLRQDCQSQDVQALEEKTGLEVAVASGPPASWRSIAQRVQIILVELPVDPKILQDTLEEARNSPLGWPVVIHDKSHTLDESLFQPPVRFKHVTGHLSVDELATVVASTLAQAAQDRRAIGEAREPWLDLLIGRSQAMRELHALIRLVGPRQSTVLITGETGSGKEMVARAIHMASRRSGSVMVAVNCPAIPENLVEAELFGHAKGAFTGAVNQRVGRFEQAHRGTIFLDEVGEIPLEIQPKLLRVLQEREFERVGSSETVQIDARVVAATNIDLELAVEQRRFRQDLLYRLNVVPIRVPPLRARASDIPHLTEHFVEKICRRETLPSKTVSSSAMERLLVYHWPGNVRQLEHVIEKAVSLAGNRERLYLWDFQLPEARPVLPGAGSEINLPATGLDFEKVIGQVERLLIREALRTCDGNKAKAARVLGLKRTTMLYKAKAHEACASCGD